MCFDFSFEVVNEATQPYHVQSQPVKTGDYVEAIIVNAPCVVKVVPYNGGRRFALFFMKDPHQYDDLMEVYLPEDPTHPQLLPLIRMTCGTILIVKGN